MSLPPVPSQKLVTHKIPLTSPVAPPPAPFLSSAILHLDGNIVYVSGALGIKAGKMVAGGVENRFEQAISNASALLREAKASLADVVTVTIYLANIGRDISAINKAFKQAFKGEVAPTLTVVQTSALPLDTDVEVTCTAILNQKQKRLELSNYSNGSSSPAISVGEYVFVSGLTASMDGGLRPQFEEVVAGLKALLAQANMTIKNVVSVMLHLSNYTEDVLPLNEIYLDRLGLPKDGPKPTRTCLGVEALTRGRISLGCVAVRDPTEGDRMKRPQSVLPGASLLPFLDIAVPCLSNRLCFISGAHKPGDTSTGSVAERTSFSIKWIKYALQSMGLSLEDVITVTAYLTDYKTNFSDFNTAYMAGFPAPRPSRTCIGVKHLPQGTDVEITCVAAIPARIYGQSARRPHL